MADGYLNFDTKIDESGFNSGISKLGGIAKTGFAAVGAAAVGAVTGVALLTKSAVTAYAEFEQLAGGAELMFGNAYKSVMKNAQEAYSTVQMSQNEYLQQVNGFATGLKTALGGNEQAAADLAHKIIQAEADIVAATGETAENVQNAFNGIMKSNFTMLDNLKLGITPTKEGFQEVIDKVNEWNAANGNATNYMIDNLADCQSALVDYIEMQGMAGYAAAEAAGTIQGSLSMMQSAWANLLVGFADSSADLDSLMDAFIGSAMTFAENVVPIIATAVPRIAEALIEGIPMLTEAATEVLDGLYNCFVESGPLLAENALNLVMMLAEGIVSALPMLAETALTIILSLASSLATFIPQLLSQGIQMIVQIAKGLASALPDLVAKIPEIINTFCDGMYALLPQLIEAGIQIIVALGVGIIKSIPAIIANAGQIVKAILNVFTAFSLVKIGKTLIQGLGTAIKGAAGNVVSAVKSIISKIKSNFQSINWGSIGKAIVTGVANGITNGAGAIVRAAKNAAKKAFDAAKSFLGINSPSRLFRDEVGKYMAEGMGVGFEENVPTDDMGKAIDQSVNKLNSAVSAHMKVPQTTSERAVVVQNENGHIENDSPGDVYEIHVHTHLGAKEIAEETVVYNDEQLGKRNKRKERGNAG